MQSSFDIFDLYDTPTIVLCNPNRDQLYAMKEIYDTNLILRYNAMGEFSFKVPSQVDGNTVDYYSYLNYPRIVYVEDTGYFIITDVATSGDGVDEFKSVKCFAGEYVFATKKVSQFKGTYKFYDAIDATGTLISELLAYVPGWTVGTIDISLLVKYRTFDVSDTTIYNLLMAEVENAYQCIFTFDTINKTISASVPTQASATTDVYFSYDNLMEAADLEPINEELVTALAVYGGGDLSINTVNPLGTNTIYNYDYFKTTDWMSQSLIDAIDAWETVIENNQDNYADLLSALKDYYEVLLT